VALHAWVLLEELRTNRKRCWGVWANIDMDDYQATRGPTTLGKSTGTLQAGTLADRIPAFAVLKAIYKFHASLAPQKLLRRNAQA